MEAYRKALAVIFARADTEGAGAVYRLRGADEKETDRTTLPNLCKKANLNNAYTVHSLS